jgi:hypothetical protein
MLPLLGFFYLILEMFQVWYFCFSLNFNIYIIVNFDFTGGRRTFREFLKSEYSEENILFWLACEDLKKEENPEIVEEKARLIYEDYISILSPKEVTNYFNYVEHHTLYRMKHFNLN